MISRDIYLIPILDNVPRLLGLLNRNISSSSYGCFDREFWHYNTADIPCARKQEAVLTLTLLYLTEHSENKYYRSTEMLPYISAAMMYWTKIQNKNGSFNEWYPNEHSFVVTAFSTYAVSESLLLLREEIPGDEYQALISSLRKAGDWLVSRNEIRVMNQQTGAVIALYNLYLLTNDTKYLYSAKDKISLLKQRQSREGWFIEYGGPDMGYLSLAIDYLCKYYKKSKDETAGEIIKRAIGFIRHFIQPNLIAGGEYTSRNTEYLIPHGLEIFSTENDDARFAASVARKTLTSINSFPRLFDERYLAYVGYTWLQAYEDANPEIDDKVDSIIAAGFSSPFSKYYDESGLVIINDTRKHFIVNLKKGGAFRLFDKTRDKTYSDSGILVRSGGKWYTAGWLTSESRYNISDDKITVQGNMWKVPDKSLTSGRYVLLRLFQMTFGRSGAISLWLKERLRDILITRTSPSEIKYKRTLSLNVQEGELLEIRDSVESLNLSISVVAVFAKDTQIYVPSSRYYTSMNDAPFKKDFSSPVKKVEIDWKIGKDPVPVFIVN